MTDVMPKGNTRPSYPAGFTFWTPLLAGLVFALAVYGLLVYAEMAEREKSLEFESARSLVLLKTRLDAIWDRAASFAEQAARRMSGADAARNAALLGQYKALWPEAGFSVYDKNGEWLSLIQPDGGADAAPVPHTARDLVHRALVGQSAKDITLLRGFMSLSAACPLRAGEGRVLVVSAPLDTSLLRELRELSRSEVAVLPLDDAGGTVSDPESAANTFTLGTSAAASAWEQLCAFLKEQRIDSYRHVPLSGVGAAVVAPLAEGKNAPKGVLVSASMRVGSPDYFAPWRIASSLAAGLAAALILAWLLRRRGQRVAAALAGAVASMTIDRAEAREAWKLGAWPPAMEEALEKVAGALREYRLRAWNAERELGRAGSQAREEAVQSEQDEENYRRLFSNAPVGVFQAERDGRFIRVNQAFAYLLGYDSPTALVTECASFSEFFLYGDEMRNPLNSLFGQWGERHLISLRRRDGRVRHFSLVFSPVTARNGEPENVLEGFLLDRDLDEQLTKAALERDAAKRQRASLALLLAATCRQIRSYLDFDHRSFLTRERMDEAPAGDDGPDDAPGAISERRKSMHYVKTIVGDIYQIAMAEVEAQPPVSVPIEFGRFLSRVCRQAMPGMHARGVSLRCEVTEELLQRLRGPAPMLRHTLQRALLAVTAPARGGWVWLYVMRDPNAPRTPGLSRVLFSVSWSAYSRDMNAVVPGMQEFGTGGGQNMVAFDAPADPDAVLSEEELGAEGLELGREQEVIRYLAQRMRGELLEGVFTNETRSIQLIVPLENLAAGAAEHHEGAEAADEPAGAAPGADGPADDAAAGEADFIHEAGEAPYVGSAQAHPSPPLDILVESEERQPGDFAVYEDDAEDGLNILLVDDSMNNRLLFSLFLRDTRHRITETHDGQQGVEAFQRGHYDVIFMDMEMPLMDGYQATRIIRALEADKGLPPTPIVGMTTYSLPEFRRQCMLSGCTDFLSKPFSKIALAALLDAFVQMKRDKEQAADA